MPDAAKPQTKIVYIDHLKIVLTVLVILHHTFITYGAPGGWYYSQPTHLQGALVPMTLFVAVNQAFFMGFFFFLSALFVPTSYDRKGPLKFIADRLVRLGIPLLFYSFVLSPFLIYLPYNFAGTRPSITYMQFLSGFDGWINFGVMWFVLALLMFTVGYVLYRLAAKGGVKLHHFPSATAILLFAIGIGVVTYVVRMFYPVGRVIDPLGFQPGHFPQYIAMFIFGSVASRSNWIHNANYRTGKTMLVIAICLVVIGFPLFFVAVKLLKFPVSYFNVGGHWQSLWYAVWEQLVGFTMVTTLICIGKQKWNESSRFLNTLSRSTFAVYIFHPLVLISSSVALHNWMLEPALKLLVVAPLAVIGSFLLGMLLVRIPVINKVL